MSAKEVEAQLRRNQRVDFKAVEATRRPFDTTTKIQYTQTVCPDWTFGAGANHLQSSSAEHTPIDPSATSRTRYSNYKLLVSAITPRPIALVSTCSRDGLSANLAPMSFFQLVNVDPPMFALAITSPMGEAKDTLRNLLETGECVINVVSEGFVEAVNATSLNAPYGASEWDVSGLTPVYDCKVVKAARVKEAVFSVEAKLESVRDFYSRLEPGRRSGSLELLEGVQFWVRDDAWSQDGMSLDLEVSMRFPFIALQPCCRLRGLIVSR